MGTTCDDYTVIFRRFRRLKNGTLLDARKYGLKAWPIRIRKKAAKKSH